MEQIGIYLEIPNIESLLINILKSAYSGIIVIDIEQRIILFSPRAKVIFNIQHNDIIGKNYKEVLPKEVRKMIEEVWDKTINEGRVTERLECEFIKPDKSITVVGATTAPLTDEYGNITGMVIISQDITDKRKMIALEEVNKLKSEFVSTVSHELRTPLTSIQGFSELILTKDYPIDKIKSFAEKINKESERLSRLIENLLDLSRIESGRIKLNKEEFNIKEIIKSCAEFFTPALGNSHKLILNLQEVKNVYADKDRIQQVINNLISNAIKYSPEGGEIKVKLYQKDNEIITEVSDQGIGIPEEHLPHLFERFHRIEREGMKKIPGTGLGLCICKAIVELHNGKMWVESKTKGDNRGSIFYFSLPVK